MEGSNHGSTRSEERKFKRHSLRPVLTRYRFTENKLKELRDKGILTNPPFRILEFIFDQTSDWGTYHFSAKHCEIAKKTYLAQGTVTKAINYLIKNNYLIKFKLGKHTIYHLNQEIFGKYTVTRLVDNRIATYEDYFTLLKECFEDLKKVN